MQQLQKPKQGYKIVRINLRRYEEIPTDWNVVPLRSLVKDIQTGFAEGERDEDGILQLRMNNISDDGTLNLDKTLKVPVPADIDKYDLEKNDVLFNNTNSLDLIGKSTIIKNDLNYTFSNHITRIRTKDEELIPYFLILSFLKYKKDTLFRSICNTHVGQSDIGKDELLKIGIILPSVPEQQKIASILSNVDSLIQQTQNEIEQTQRLKKGLMQRLLTKGIGHTKFKQTELEKIPEDWNVVKLKDIATIRGGKRLPIGEKYSEEKTDYPYIRIVDFQNGTVITDNLVYLKESTFQKMKNYSISAKDVYISIVGSLLGIAGTIPSQLDGAILTENAAKLCNLNVNEEFLSHFLNSSIGQKQITSYRSNAGKPKLALFRIGKFIVFLPSLKEQNEIVSIVSNFDSYLKTQQECKSNLETLKKGLMQKLLTGQVRVKV